jgi:uncharacterized small protein (DUF1192 family)
MNWKEMIGITIGVVTLMGIGYKAALKGKWIIDPAIAQEIVNQALIPGEIERLEFQLEYKRSQLRQLRKIEQAQRSEEDQDAVDELKSDIGLLQYRLCRLKGGAEEECKSADDS